MPLNPADPLVALATELSRQPPLLGRVGQGASRAAPRHAAVRLLPEEWALLFPDLPAEGGAQGSPRTAAVTH